MARQGSTWWVSRSTYVALAMGLLLACRATGSAAEAPQDRAISLTYGFPKAQLRRAAPSSPYLRINIAGCGNLSRRGEPAVPYHEARILVPPGYRVRAVAVRLREPEVTQRLESHVEFGRTAIPFGVDRQLALAMAAADAPKPEVYESDAPYPSRRVELTSVQRLRGHAIAIVRLFPAQYVPSHKELRLCTSLWLDVEFAPEQSGNRGLVVPIRGNAAASVAALVDNPDLLSEYEALAESKAGTQEEEEGAPLTGTGSYDYLLISNAALLPSFQPLIDRKTAVGLTVATETVEHIYANYTGVDNPEKIRNCIKDYYTNSGIEYVLLGGDTSVVPCRGAYGYTSTADEPNLPTDLYYSCLDGSWNSNGDAYWGTPVDAEPGYADIDLLGEVYVGRAPVDTAEEATRFVNKVKGYELSGNPNVGKCLFLGEYLGNGAQGGDALDTIAPYFAGRTVEWLDDRPHTSAQWTNTACIAELNESPHIVAHVGHGNATTVMRLSREDVDLLTNTHLWLVNSMACYSGAFDSSDCIAEDLSKRNSSAAFAAIMNTRYGWYKDSDPSKYSVEFQQKFFDCLLSQGVAKIGAALQQSKHDMVGEVENSGSMTYRWCYFTITLFGDPHTELASAGDPALTVRSFDDSAGVDDYFGGVTIDVDPDPDADTPFTRSYAQGTALTLTAPATHGELTFSHWKLDGADQTAGVAELSVTMGTDHTAVAVYEAQTLPLLIDMAVFEEGTADLNPTGPAPASLTILSIDMPGATETTEIAMTVGGGQWLRFVTDPSSNVDVYTDGGAAEWHTPAEWASKRIRGLTPGATYDFQAKTRDGPGEPESELSDVGSYATNAACDVDRSGAVDQTDLDYARDAILSAAGIGTSGKPWATDVNGDRETHVLDIILIRGDIPGD